MGIRTKEQLDAHIKQSGTNMKAYAESIGEDPSNFKRKIWRHIDYINTALAPLGLEVVLSNKKQ